LITLHPRDQPIDSLAVDPLSTAGDHLLPCRKVTASRHAMPKIGQHAEVLPSSFGMDPALISAVAIVINNELSNPINIERR
jgi:hypothetical protein